MSTKVYIVEQHRMGGDSEKHLLGELSSRGIGRGYRFTWNLDPVQCMWRLSRSDDVIECLSWKTPRMSGRDFMDWVQGANEQVYTFIGGLVK